MNGASYRHQTRQLLLENRLKVFATLTGFLAEYRSFQRDEHGRMVTAVAPLLACCHSLMVSGRSRMRPEKYPYVPPLMPVYRGDRAWMV